MGIKDATGRNQGSPLQLGLRAETALAREERRLNEKYLRSSTAEMTDIDELALVERLRRVAKRDAWESLSRSEARNMVLSLSYRGEGQLASDEAWIVTKFLDFLASDRLKTNRHRFFSRVVNQYLLNFDPESWLTRLLGDHLCKYAPSIRDSRRLAHILKAHSDFDLFRWHAGPRNLARHIVDNRKIARDVFDRIDLRNDARNGGFAEFAFVHACKRIYDLLCATPNTDVVVPFLAWAENTETKSFVYKSRYPETAWALLAPWIDPHRSVPSGIRDRLIRFFSDQFKDPRTATHQWEKVDPSARDVLLRWLTLDVLDLFFKIVQEVVDEGGLFGHQWEARKRFWKEFVNHGLVANSMVAFGRAGIPRAEQAKKEIFRKHHYHVRYLSLREAERTQSVLLLHLAIPSPTGGTNTFVIADWSHNGSLRIWKKSNPAAPDIAPSSSVIYGSQLRTEPDTPPIRHVGSWETRAYSALLDLSGYTYFGEVESMSDFLRIIGV